MTSLEQDATAGILPRVQQIEDLPIEERAAKYATLIDELTIQLEAADPANGGA